MKRTETEVNIQKRGLGLSVPSPLSQPHWYDVGVMQRAAARKRSHPWCLSLTPNNTKTIGRMFPATNQERPSEQLLHYSRCPMGVNDLFQVRAVTIHTRELQQRRRRRQPGRQKSNRFITQNNNFARSSRFLYISLPSLHDYEVKMADCKFYGERNQAKTNLFFSL